MHSTRAFQQQFGGEEVVVAEAVSLAPRNSVCDVVVDEQKTAPAMGLESRNRALEVLVMEPGSRSRGPGEVLER
jgi:hypothetical protein